MRVLLGGIVCLVVLALAPVAEGAQRYASPTGSGTSCEQAAPCQIKEAITKAQSNDEVIVGAGEYSIPSPLYGAVGASNLYVHGDLAGPMPKLKSAFSNTILTLQGDGGRVSYLEFLATTSFATGVSCGLNGSVDRVRSFAKGAVAVAIIQNENCAVRDSVAVAEGSESIGMHSVGLSADPSASTGVARNVIAIASGPKSVGIRSVYNWIAVGSHTLDAKNVIADGAGADLLAYKGAFGPGNIVISNSNFDNQVAEAPATITGGANQTAAPEFVNAPGGDYREQPGAPTIDAGASDPQLGPLDPAGDARTLGAAPDIGAYEFVPPPPPPPPAGQILSLALTPRVFRAAKSGQAIASAKKKVPVGSTGSYEQQQAGRVLFEVEMATKGRRVGKGCVKKTRANKGKPKCTLLKPVAGSFKHDGIAGQNTFKFTGRLAGKALKPGRYQLVGRAGGAVKRANFTIVK